MNFSRLSRSALAAISAILATIFTLLFVAILAPSSQAQSPPETTIVSTEINRSNTVAFNGKQALQQDVNISQDGLTTLLIQASVQFRLRDILAKYGIPPEETVSVSLRIEDKEAIEYELPPGHRRLGSEPIVKSFKDAIFEDFLCPTDISFKLLEKFRKVHKMPEPVPQSKEEMKLKITFTNQDENGEPISEITFFERCVLCWMGPIPWWCVS